MWMHWRVQDTREGVKEGSTLPSWGSVAMTQVSEGVVRSRVDVLYLPFLSLWVHTCPFPPHPAPRNSDAHNTITWLPCRLTSMCCWLEEDKERDLRSRGRVWADGDSFSAEDHCSLGPRSFCCGHSRPVPALPHAPSKLGMCCSSKCC